MTRRALIVWTVIALVVSFLPLLAVEAAGAARTLLALTHLAVAAVLIPVLCGHGSCLVKSRI